MSEALCPLGVAAVKSVIVGAIFVSESEVVVVEKRRDWEVYGEEGDRRGRVLVLGVLRESRSEVDNSDIGVDVG